MIQRQEVEGLQCHVEVLDFTLQGAGEARYDQLDLRECPGGSVGQGLGWGETRRPDRMCLQWTR